MKIPQWNLLLTALLRRLEVFLSDIENPHLPTNDLTYLAYATPVQSTDSHFLPPHHSRLSNKLSTAAAAQKCSRYLDAMGTPLASPNVCKQFDPNISALLDL